MLKSIYAFIFCMLLANFAYADDAIVQEQIIYQNEQNKKRLQDSQVLTKNLFNLSMDNTEVVSNFNWSDEYPCFIINHINLNIHNHDEEYFRNRFAFVLSDLTSNPNKNTYALNRCIGSQNLKTIVNIAQNALLTKGYTTSQISVDEQDLTDGILDLTLFIGRIDKIIYQDNQSPFFIKQAIPLKENAIFNLRKLEQGIDNLREIDRHAKIDIIPSDDITKEQSSILAVQLTKTRNIHGNLSIYNTPNNSYGNYMLNGSLSGVNLVGINDEWHVFAGLPIDRKSKNKNDVQLDYQLKFGILHQNTKWAFSHSQNQYKRFVAGFDKPIEYHGQSINNTWSATHLLKRGTKFKTEGYAKVYLKKSQHWIEDIPIEVQSRRTAGYHIGLSHQQHLANNGYLYANLDYRHGTAMLGAKPAPEEEVYTSFGEKLPPQGYARSPLLSWYASLTQTWQKLGYELKVQGQYAFKSPTPEDLCYVGGKHSVRGFESSVLAGEHCLSLQQEFSFLLPNAKNHHHWRLYGALDWGIVGKASHSMGARHLMGAGFGIRHSHNRWATELFLGKSITAIPSNKKQPILQIQSNVFF